MGRNSPEWLAPTTLEEAFALRAEYETKQPKKILSDYTCT
jgi:hypothetical protein